jgi:hypothetical protein
MTIPEATWYMSVLLLEDSELHFNTHTHVRVLREGGVLVLNPSKPSSYYMYRHF